MARTRESILAAAVGVLRDDPTASLTSVAEAAGTARSTLHRYFAERADLIGALRQRADEQVAQATERAQPDEGTGADALTRLCHAYFELGDLIDVAYAGISEREDLDDLGDLDRALLAVIERGQVDGSIDPVLSAAWVRLLLWQLLEAAWSMATSRGVTKHEALGLCLRTLDKLVDPGRRRASSGPVPGSWT